MKSRTCENDISSIILEYYSRVTPLLIFQKYFANLNEKDIIDNRKFWQIVKPFLSEKLKSRENITLVGKEELVSSESDVAQRFNQFFSNIVKNLDIPKYVVEDTLHLNLKNHPILMAILKYRDHPSIITIKRFRYQTVPFHFSHIDKKTVLKIIRSLSNNKASQETDLSVIIVKKMLNILQTLFDLNKFFKISFVI